MAFADVIRRTGQRILFDADAEPSVIERMSEVTLLIGPEGGWTDEELSAARAAGCLFQRLGPRLLRAETRDSRASERLQARDDRRAHRQERAGTRDSRSVERSARAQKPRRR